MVKDYPIRFVITVSLVFLSGCAQQSPRTTQTQEAISSPMPHKSTATPQPPTEVITSTLNPTPSPKSTTTISKAKETQPELGFSQIDILDSAPEDGKSEGVLALLDGANGRNYLLDLASGLIHWIDESSGQKYCWTVSPGQDRLLCEDSENRMISLLDNQGNTVQSIPWNAQWDLFLGWLSDERILFMKHVPGSDLAHTIAYDLANRAEVELVPDYPEINDLEPFDNVGPFSATATFYNPSLQMVIFPSRRLTNVLWDLSKNRIIAQISYTQNPYPAWSPDGEQVLVAGEGLWSETLGFGEAAPPELYLADRSGEVKQLTTLSQMFPKYRIMNISWSPDGKRIGFQLNTEDPVCASRCIVLLDPVSGKMEGYKLPFGFGSSMILEPNYRITWSPEDRYLLLQIYQENNWENPDLMIFDINRQVAYPVAKNVRILGWMR